MQPNDPTFIRLGLLINFLAVIALLVVVIRTFQPETTNLLAQVVAPGNGMRGGGMGMGGGSAMMRFHQAAIPPTYAGATNPIAADTASLERGQAAYQIYCVACHGERGMGDGVAGASLDPAPAPIARSSQMMGDDYLFWRVSEGGAHFSTAMPAWEAALDEQTRWDLVNYIRVLGSGQTPGRGMGQAGGAGADPAADMVAAGVAQAIITQTEADTFLTVHALMEEQISTNPDLRGAGAMLERQQAALTALVEAHTIEQAAADMFTTVRDRLTAAGLMQ